MLTSIVQIEMHLAGIGIAELSDLQIDDEERAKPPMEENEIDPNHVSSIRRRRYRPKYAKSSPSSKRKSAK